MAISLGEMGQTLCPLRPYGHIEIEGEVYEAKAENGWIDQGVDVFVVKSGSLGIVVCEHEEGDGQSPESVPKASGLQTTKGQSTIDSRASSDSNALIGTEFWLERMNLILVGAILWTAIGASILLTGVPLSLEVLLLPVGGAISGAIFQYFIRGARDLVGGPYSDHRPKAYSFAIWMSFVAIFAVSLTFLLGAGIGIITCGLILGTLCGALWELFF